VTVTNPDGGVSDPMNVAVVNPTVTVTVSNVSGLAITPPIAHSFEVRCAAFDPSERFFLTTTARPYAQLHHVPPGRLSRSNVENRIRLLASGEIDANGDFVLR